MKLKTYELELSVAQLRDLFFVVDHVVFMEKERFDEFCKNGGNKEDHIYQKALNSQAILENII